MEILRNLARRKLRSSLTVSGIVIGILALTTMGAMAEHVNALLAGGVTFFGGSIQVAADSETGSLLSLDLEKQVAAVPGVAAVAPAIQLSAEPGGGATVSFGPPPAIQNVEPMFNPHQPLAFGLASGRPVQADGEVVLGSDLATQFGKRVGDTIALPVRPKDARPGFVQATYRVVGVLDKTQTQPDSVAYITLQDAQRQMAAGLPPAIRGAVDPSRLVQGFVVFGAPGSTPAQLDAVAQRIGDQVPGIRASKPSQEVAAFRSGSVIFSTITMGAALLALVIGGLSVINTMLMAVTERVREIGLKKALGARTSHILREFLAESVFIGALGGVLGYGLGVALTAVLNRALGPSQALFLVTPGLTAVALGFATGLGALAGVLPAARAARLDPVVALRAQ